MLVKGHFTDIWKHRINQGFQFFYRANFDDPLAKVVTKLVTSNLREDVEYAFDQGTHKGTFTWLDIFQLLLNHSTSSLIKTESLDLLNCFNFLSS